MKLDIHDLQGVEAWLKNPAPAVFQRIDLVDAADEIARRDLGGCSFLGCVLGDALAVAAAKASCLILPPVPESAEMPFDPYQGKLYGPNDLYEGYIPTDSNTYETYRDRRIYRSYMDNARNLRPASADLKLLRRMHDASVSEALEDLVTLARGRIVAIMGGHDRQRSEPIYRDVAHMALSLTKKGFLVATGGGPGLMEAANLGAYAAGFSAPEQTIETALVLLERASRFDPKTPEWLRVGYETWKQLGVPQNPGAGRSVGIPTWFYGHEPPNMFATDIAKYFENSVREEGMLGIAHSGIIFAEGNGGTVQEIFQDACQNYYRTYSKLKSPMVLLGKDYWSPPFMDFRNPRNRPKQVYALLRKLGAEKGFADYIHLTDSTSDAIDFIERHPPIAS